ncbi:hypothetical protein BDP27DRAFT_1428213 [Rhodocollybia butyracea]|uniref:Uncharacterized protein n=1 Tax=Rhodocollybia butyracea TaxID=206335 RepID=A0A9P5PF22_9AGAR|nr:hypothetical protein BDP27DRAFT_1428213 [Rhodocollybia butyracea]
MSFTRPYASILLAASISCIWASPIAVDRDTLREHSGPSEARGLGFNHGLSARGHDGPSSLSSGSSEKTVTPDFTIKENQPGGQAQEKLYREPVSYETGQVSKIVFITMLDGVMMDEMRAKARQVIMSAFPNVKVYLGAKPGPQAEATEKSYTTVKFEFEVNGVKWGGELTHPLKGNPGPLPGRPAKRPNRGDGNALGGKALKSRTIQHRSSEFTLSLLHTSSSFTCPYCTLHHSSTLSVLQHFTITAMRLTVPYASVLLVASFSCTWATPIVNRNTLIQEHSGSALSSRATDPFGSFEGFHALRARGDPNRKGPSSGVTGSRITKSTKPPPRAQHLTEAHLKEGNLKEASPSEMRGDALISNIDEDKRRLQTLTSFYFDEKEDNTEQMRARAKRLIENAGNEIEVRIPLMSKTSEKPFLPR